MAAIDASLDVETRILREMAAGTSTAGNACGAVLANEVILQAVRMRSLWLFRRRRVDPPAPRDP